MRKPPHPGRNGTPNARWSSDPSADGHHQGCLLPGLGDAGWSACGGFSGASWNEPPQLPPAKQAMVELVHHLEIHGYVERVPHLTDRRAKLVVPTDRGRDVITIAQHLAPELENRIRNLFAIHGTRRRPGVMNRFSGRDLMNRSGDVRPWEWPMGPSLSKRPMRPSPRR